MPKLQEYRQLLSEFVALRSVSTDAAYRSEIKATVDWLQRLFGERGFKVNILEGSESNPVVVARYDAGKKKTVLVYGHYDVQPAEMEQGWTADPFRVQERDGRFIGRGVVDNKGQLLIHMLSVFQHILAGTLGANVVFVIEGNEETSNPDLPKLLRENQELFACDEVLISDGEMVGDTPTIDVSLRGGFNLRIELRTAASDMHSGLVGGGVPNAAQELNRVITGLFDEKGRVMVPGFYDGIGAPSQEVLRSHAKLMELNPPLESLPARSLLSANDTDFYTQTGLFPTVQVTGVSSGYTGEGFANIVPAVAEARLNVRLVAGQNVEGIADGLAAFLRAACPEYAEVSIEVEGLHQPVKLDNDSMDVARAAAVLDEVYGQPPIYKYVGGAIPVVSDFKEVLKVSPLLVSLGNDDCNMHGPDENFRIDLITKGLEFSRRFFAGEDRVE